MPSIFTARLARPRQALAIVTAGTLLSLAPLSAVGAAEESDSPEVSNSTILAANAYPGVQLISTTYTATVTVAIPVVNEAAVADLGRRLATQVQSGSIDLTTEAVTEEIVAAIVASPGTYFMEGPRTYSKRNSLTGVGTGWAITPDGYLITAAHVVQTPDDELRQQFAANRLDKLGRQFVKGLDESGTPLTQDQVSRMTDAILGWLANHMSVDDLSVSVAANLAYGIDGFGKDQKPVTAEVVDVGSPYPGNDVALLKIDGQEHLPTISLGANDDVSPGATVHVVGFPAASTFSAGFSVDSQVQPTVTEGPVTAVKSTGSGMPVFQTQAPASPGNSGGPVLTDDGQSVGVLVATALNGDGTAAAGQAFVIPASEVQDMLEQNGVTAEESDTSKAYAGAVEAFYADRFKEALPLFERSETLYPAHPFAGKFIADSKTAIEAGEDKTPVKETKSSGLGALWFGLGGFGLALLLGGAAAALLMRRQRARLTALAAPAAPVVPAVPPTYYAPQAYPAPAVPVAPAPPSAPPSVPHQMADQPGGSPPSNE